MREVVGDALSHLSEYMDGSKTHKSEIASLIYLLRRDNAEILFQTKIYFYQTPKVDVIDGALCKRGFQYVLQHSSAFHTPHTTTYSFQLWRTYVSHSTTDSFLIKR